MKNDILTSSSSPSASSARLCAPFLLFVFFAAWSACFPESSSTSPSSLSSSSSFSSSSSRWFELGRTTTFCANDAVSALAISLCDGSLNQPNRSATVLSLLKGASLYWRRSFCPRATNGMSTSDQNDRALPCNRRCVCVNSLAMMLRSRVRETELEWR